MPDPSQLSAAPASEPASIPTLDGWIESLMSCKQLAESDVQRLCDKVREHAGLAEAGQGALTEMASVGSRGAPGRVQRTASGK